MSVDKTAATVCNGKSMRLLIIMLTTLILKYDESRIGVLLVTNPLVELINGTRRR